MTVKTASVLGLTLAVTAVTGCAGGPAAAPQLPPAAFVSGAQGPSEDYVIGPLDSLTIFVWRNPELGGKVQVRPDGRITTPLIADLPASAGRRRSCPTTSKTGWPNISRSRWSP